MSRATLCPKSHRQLSNKLNNSESPKRGSLFTIVMIGDKLVTIANYFENDNGYYEAIHLAGLLLEVREERYEKYRVLFAKVLLFRRRLFELHGQTGCFHQPDRGRPNYECSTCPHHCKRGTQRCSQLLLGRPSVRMRASTIASWDPWITLHLSLETGHRAQSRKASLPYDFGSQSWHNDPILEINSGGRFSGRI
jgi:hypothetical protein